MEDHMTTLKPIAPSSTAPDEVEQHSLPATVAYHLLPGLLILAVTVAAVPVVRAAGLPPSPHLSSRSWSRSCPSSSAIY
jgi:hypothetical protein